MDKNHYIYRQVALILAFVVFITSVGFSVDIHYCQGKFKSFSLLKKAKNCHEMAAQMTSCTHHQVEDTESDMCGQDDDGCCTNDFQTIQSDIDKCAHSATFDFLQTTQHFIVSFSLASLFEYEESEDVAITSFDDDIPPLISRDIYVRHQSFLL